MTEDEAIEYARRCDPQYFQLDAEAAKNLAFGGPVCGGFHTSALTWRMALRSGTFVDCPPSIGIDEPRGLAPVQAGIEGVSRGARDRGVRKDLLDVRIARRLFKDSLPRARIRPACKTPIHAVPVARAP